jgi:membrane protein DedA with SNARE-associated domain
VGYVIHALQHISPFLIYLLVTAFLLLESSGIPVVNTTLLLCAGALAALGRVNLFTLMVVAIVGSTLGACSAYGLGRLYGEPLLLRLARLLRIDKRKVALAESWFHKAGGRMIFFSRMLPYIRPFACFPAGISAMSFPRFLLAAAAGSTIWCIAFLMVGWELGPNWKLAVHLIRDYTLPALGALLVLLIVYFFARYAFNRYMKRRLAEQDEAAEHDHDLLEV